MISDQAGQSGRRRRRWRRFSDHRLAIHQSNGPAAVARRHQGGAAYHPCRIIALIDSAANRRPCMFIKPSPSSLAAIVRSDRRWPVLGFRRCSRFASATSSGFISSCDRRPSHLPSRARLRSLAQTSCRGHRTRARHSPDGPSQEGWRAVVGRRQQHTRASIISAERVKPKLQ